MRGGRRITLFFFFQAEDGIRDRDVTGFRRVLFRSERRWGWTTCRRTDSMGWLRARGGSDRRAEPPDEVEDRREDPGPQVGGDEHSDGDHEDHGDPGEPVVVPPDEGERAHEPADPQAEEEEWKPQAEGVDEQEERSPGRSPPGRSDQEDAGEDGADARGPSGAERHP